MRHSKILATAAVLALVAAAPAHAFTFSRPLPQNVSYIVPQEHPDAMPATAWKSGDEVQVAQSLLLGVGVNPVAGGGGGGYTGLGDVKSVGASGAYYALRPYTAAIATALGALFNLCDNALLNCHDVHATASGGLNAADLAFNSCDTSGLCQVKILYQQSASGQPNLTLCVTTGGCPLYLPNGISSGKPTMANNTGTISPSGSITSTSPPYSFAAVLAAPNASTGSNERLFVAPDPVGLLCCASGHWSFFSSGLVSATATLTANTFYGVQAGTDGTGSGAFVKQSGSAASTGLNAGSAAFTGTPAAMMQTGQKFSELAFFSVLNNGTDQTNIENNITGYWGI